LHLHFETALGESLSFEDKSLKYFKILVHRVLIVLKM